MPWLLLTCPACKETLRRRLRYGLPPRAITCAKCLHSFSPIGVKVDREPIKKLGAWRKAARS